MINKVMDFFKSRSFLLALISTVVCMIIFYSYGEIFNKVELIRDLMFLSPLFFFLNVALFYFVHSNNSVSNNLILNEDRLHYALKASGEGIFDWDIKTNKVYYSKTLTEMFGYTQQEFGFHFDSFTKVLHAEDRDFVHESVDQFIKGQLSEYCIEFRAYHKDGRLLWINARAEILKNMRGEPMRVIGTNRDITDVKTKEEGLIENIEEAEQYAEAKSSFLAHMSHEIRTPLTAITGVSEILEKQSKDFNPKQKQLVKTLTSSSQNLKELINDILDFSKIEKGEVELDYKYFPLPSMIAEIISILSVPAQEKNIQFIANDDAVKNLNYLGDKTRIRQVLINIVGNAIKFTSEGRVALHIELVEKQGEEFIHFIVQDTGIGIDAEYIDHIFNEFQQADKSVSRQHGGTGLGLSISKKLAVLMGGDIQVESKKGLGSTFTFILPMTDQHKKIITDGNTDTHSKINDRLLSIVRDEQRALIVDDYQGNVVVLSYIMEEIGMPFDVVHNGQEAVDQWSKKHYDFVLMDVQMPVMDGITATKTIREIEQLNNFDATVIIGMTAHALIEDKEKCIQSGMTDYLSKPIDSHQLKEKVYSYLLKANKKVKEGTA